MAGLKSVSTPTSQPGYDLLVLGSGEAGKYIAWTLARKGMKTAVIERKYIGGSCPNIACLPSKNVIHSAKVASYFRRSEEFGITKDNWKIDMPAVRERKRKMVTGLVEMHLDLYKKNGAELVMGSGRFVGPKTIEVTSADGLIRLLHGKRVVINTGTRATIDPIPGLAEANPLTHIEALDLDCIPEHLLVLGGGYVGRELSQAMRRFGSRVTIIERNLRLLHREDQDISTALHELFKDEGIEVVTSARITRVEGKSGESVKLQANRNRSETVLEGTHLLAATGRTPNTGGIGYRLAKIPLTAVLRTRTLSETRGFMKALIEAKSDRILGFTVFGVEAGEVMASVQVAMIAGLPYTALRDAIFTHPTMLEGLIPLFTNVPPAAAAVAKAQALHA